MDDLGFPSSSVVKNQLAMQETQEMLGLSLAWEGPLEAGTATDSNILAWRILRTQEPGKLQSMGVSKNQTQLK